MPASATQGGRKEWKLCRRNEKGSSVVVTSSLLTADHLTRFYYSPLRPPMTHINRRPTSGDTINTYPDNVK